MGIEDIVLPRQNTEVERLRSEVQFLKKLLEQTLAERDQIVKQIDHVRKQATEDGQVIAATEISRLTLSQTKLKRRIAELELEKSMADHREKKVFDDLPEVRALKKSKDQVWKLFNDQLQKTYELQERVKLLEGMLK